MKRRLKATDRVTRIASLTCVILLSSATESTYRYNISKEAYSLRRATQRYPGAGLSIPRKMTEMFQYCFTDKYMVIGCDS